MSAPLARHATITATGNYVFNMDRSIAPFAVSIWVMVPVGTTVSYEINITPDDVDTTPTADVDWFDDPQFPTGTTASAIGNYQFPVAAVRLSVASISGGPIRLHILQGFSIN
ncbi:hypothetical protein OIU35_31560 [Boseaceae bacterium BT-24-1]|nr:hypothetical protein [Boseaceae bacterium BT-24-1]